MCEFVSWIEYEGKEYFLTNADLETKEGRKLFKSDVRDDLCGHGAIMAYYPELKNKGLHQECENFSSQKNFPKAIAKALKNGQMSRIKINTDILTAPAWAEYNKVTAQAWAEYNKVTAPALAEYKKVTAPALAEYNKVTAPAWAEYNKVKDAAWAEYKKVTAPALAEYDKVTAPALAEYNKVTAQAWAEYDKVNDAALAEYNKVTAITFTNIVKQKKNRNENWK